MNRKPITRQRSTWARVGRDEPGAGPWAAFERRASDGVLLALVAEEPAGWHLSISWRGNSPRQAPRYPTWDEIADARYTLLGDDLNVAMYLPKPADYVAVHDTTFHLHEHPPRGMAEAVEEVGALVGHVGADILDAVRRGDPMPSTAPPMLAKAKAVLDALAKVVRHEAGGS